MDILIPNSWLKKYLNTKATPKEIANFLTLSGPSIEKVTKTADGDFIYSVEITTNRVDTASVIGIAREASAILPRFGIQAELTNVIVKDDKKYNFTKKVDYLNVSVDEKLCLRFTAVLIKNIKLKESPKEVGDLLKKVGVRPINNIVDVSNYIMHELGQPIHTFDYDKIVKAKMILRLSLKNEQITTLDGKTFKLDGGDIVIEDGSGKLIDLCGIMGGENSAIDSTTKNVLLFVQNYNKHKIRKTSMNLGQRSEAAVLFEKGLDSETVRPAILRAAQMIEKLSGGIAEKEILDIYPSPYRAKTVTTTKTELDKIIGISIKSSEMTTYLTNLSFKTEWNKNKLSVVVPSYRASDIDISEDIAEEIARIYGYHNIPCIMMEGQLPLPKPTLEFNTEKQIKDVLKALGAVEVYNLSLVSKDMVDKNALKLKNPLGTDTEYLRTSIRPSLAKNIEDNPQEKGYVHMFEISNIYIPRKITLPEERLILAGVIKGGEYRENKGIVEALLSELKIDYYTKIVDGKDYLPNQRLEIYSGNNKIGESGNLENGLYYYEFSIQKLISSKKIVKKYKEIAKFPPQVEDLTLVIPQKTYIGNIISEITNHQPLITSIQLTDIYENNFTFNIEYQDKNKTLTDSEVEIIRTKILSLLKSKFGINVK